MNPQSSTLVITLPFLLPLIIICSSLINLPLTSVNLTDVALVPVATANPKAPLLAPSIESPAVTAVRAVPTVTLVYVFTSNNLASYWVVAFT